MTIILVSILVQCRAKKLQEFELTHKKVGFELISIRKEFNATQPKIYALLDHIDKMNRLMHEVHNKKVTYKKKYHDLTSQTDLLKNKNLLLKEKVQALTEELEKAAQNLAQEQQLSATLKDEHDRLSKKTITQETDKQSVLNNQENQSLNLTSTSEPTSPR